MELLDGIKEYRRKMVDLGLKKGLNHKDTVRCSQKLDELLNQYEKSKTPSKRIA